MKIAIASDHAGYSLKSTIIEHLRSKGMDVVDFGTNDKTTSVDYPDYAKIVAVQVKNEIDYFGILICGTGIGMSITANKFRGIRAAVCGDTFSARMSKTHNNANILCLGSRVIGKGLACDIVDAWFAADYEGGRHAKRLDKISEIEKR